MLKVQICESVGQAFVFVYGSAGDDDDDDDGDANDDNYTQAKHIMVILKRETVLCFDVLLLSLLRFKQTIENIINLLCTFAS